MTRTVREKTWGQEEHTSLWVRGPCPQQRGGRARGAGLRGVDTMRSWSGAGAWSWQNPSFRCLRFFFFHHWDSEAGSSAERVGRWLDLYGEQRCEADGERVGWRGKGMVRAPLRWQVVNSGEHRPHTCSVHPSIPEPRAGLLGARSPHRPGSSLSWVCFPA